MELPFCYPKEKKATQKSQTTTQKSLNATQKRILAYLKSYPKATRKETADALGFGLKSFTVISQKFHNERAIYQAEHLGLDVENIQAYNAEDPKSRRAYLTTIREYFARVKMFLDILTGT